MTINKKIWKRRMTDQELTIIPCPNCQTQALKKETNSIHPVEAISSKKYRRLYPEDDDPFE
jgi:hypothetical protein